MIHKATACAMLMAPETAEGLYEALRDVFHGSAFKAIACLGTENDISHKRLAHVSQAVLKRSMHIVKGIRKNGMPGKR